MQHHLGESFGTLVVFKPVYAVKSPHTNEVQSDYSIVTMLITEKILPKLARRHLFHSFVNFHLSLSME